MPTVSHAPAPCSGATRPCGRRYGEPAVATGYVRVRTEPRRRNLVQCQGQRRRIVFRSDKGMEGNLVVEKERRKGNRSHRKAGMAATLFCALVAASVATTSLAAVDTFKLGGDATLVHPGNASPTGAEATTTGPDAFGSVDFAIPAGLTLGQLTNLSTDFKFVVGSCLVWLSPVYGQRYERDDQWQHLLLPRSPSQLHRMRLGCLRELGQLGCSDQPRRCRPPRWIVQRTLLECPG